MAGIVAQRASHPDPIGWPTRYHGVMCGRYTLTVDAAVLAELFDLDAPTDLKPRYNIAPTQMVPVVRAGLEAPREWASLRWGLIPSWAKDASIGSRLINARSESAADKPSFRSAFRHRRCLIPADGFFEWVTTDGGKQPYHLRFRDRRPFAFAGLWERWSPPEGDAVESCTILTTTANELLAPLHERMPVILGKASFAEWLAVDPLPPGASERLLSPYPSAEMEAVLVARLVNSPRNDDPRCLQPPGDQTPPRLE